MEYVYICQTHGYFCKEYVKKPKVEVACPKCKEMGRLVQEKQTLLNSEAFQELVRVFGRKSLINYDK